MIFTTEFPDPVDVRHKMNLTYESVENTLQFQLSLLHLLSANQAAEEVPKREADGLEEMMAQLLQRQ